MVKKTHISQIRFKYKSDPLDIKNININPFKQFEIWLNQAIKNKVFAPTAMAISTIKNNKLSNRIVLLKGIEKNHFVFYTNLNSRKSNDLKRNNNIAKFFGGHKLVNK